jgi:hypothetical protein
MSSPILGNVIALVLVNALGLSSSVLFLVMFIISCGAFVSFFLIRTLPPSPAAADAEGTAASAAASSLLVPPQPARPGLCAVLAQMPDVLVTWEFACIFVWTAYSGISKVRMRMHCEHMRACVR